MNKKAKSYCFMALCILLWASIPVASKKILLELDNLQMLFYSTVFSVISLIVVFLFLGRLKTLKEYSKKDYLIMGFLGFLGTYLYYVLLYGAFRLTTAQEGFILVYTWPILVLVLAFIVLKEEPTIRKVLAILISFFGIVVVITHGEIFSLHFTSLTGDVLALLGAFVFAYFSIIGKKYNFDKVAGPLIYFSSGLFFITLTMLVYSTFKIPSLGVWIWLVYNGVFVNGVSYVFWFKALEHGDTDIVSNAVYLTPGLSLFYISVFLGEKILLSSIVGLVIIISGIIVQSLGRQKIPG